MKDHLVHKNKKTFHFHVYIVTLRLKTHLYLYVRPSAQIHESCTCECSFAVKCSLSSFLWSPHRLSSCSPIPSHYCYAQLHISCGRLIKLHCLMRRFCFFFFFCGDRLVCLPDLSLWEAGICFSLHHKLRVSTC